MTSSICPVSAAMYGFMKRSWYSATNCRSRAFGSAAAASSLRRSTRTAPTAPITAICALGQAKARSLRICFEHIATYAPPMALRVTIVIFGTVAWQKA